MSTSTAPRLNAANPEPTGHEKTGEGAKSALAALIRKRQMDENHVDHDTQEPTPPQAAPGA